MDFKFYIKDLVYGANDGIITTFAIVSGVVGAGLQSNIILIIGFASLFADAFSMATSNYLGSKSEQALVQNEKIDSNVCSPLLANPIKSALYTFVAFITVGVVPLVPYFAISNGNDRFIYTLLLTLGALFIVGSFRTFITKRHFIASGMEMVIVGGIAAGVAFAIGVLVSGLV